MSPKVLLEGGVNPSVSMYFKYHIIGKLVVIDQTRRFFLPWVNYHKEGWRVVIGQSHYSFLPWVSTHHIKG